MAAVDSCTTMRSDPADPLLFMLRDVDHVGTQQRPHVHGVSASDCFVCRKRAGVRQQRGSQRALHGVGAGDPRGECVGAVLGALMGTREQQHHAAARRADDLGNTLAQHLGDRLHEVPAMQPRWLEQELELCQRAQGGANQKAVRCVAVGLMGQLV